MPEGRETIIGSQLDYFSSERAGCLFAAEAAKDPDQHGWRQVVCEPDPGAAADAIREAVAHPEVRTVSVILPDVVSVEQLLGWIRGFLEAPESFLGLAALHRDYACLGLRWGVGEDTAWISGFAPLGFLPRTRQAPYTQVTMSTKRRPQYPWVFKPHDFSIWHVADMPFPSRSEEELRDMWQRSFPSTSARLGEQPDLLSAAKTTFAVPDRIRRMHWGDLALD